MKDTNKQLKQEQIEEYRKKLANRQNYFIFYFDESEKKRTDSEILTIRKVISRNIVTCRKKSGLTQKQLAEILNVGASAVSNWECGRNSIDVDTLCDICVLFDVTLNEIFGVLSREFNNPFPNLNEQGKKKAQEYILDLSGNPLYRAHKQNNSEANNNSTEINVKTPATNTENKINTL